MELVDKRGQCSTSKLYGFMHFLCQESENLYNTVVLGQLMLIVLLYQEIATGIEGLYQHHSTSRLFLNMLSNLYYKLIF